MLAFILLDVEQVGGGLPMSLATYEVSDELSAKLYEV